MLTELRIKNFKIWQDTGSIRMAPITLFFGTNSSGKSSIGQFLMMLKQTIESSDRKAVFYPGGKNSAIQLGSYQDMVYHHQTENNMSFEYQWELQNRLEIRDPISERIYCADNLSFSAEVGVDEKEKNLIVLDNFKYMMKEKQNITASVMMIHKIGTKKEYKIDADNYTLIRKPGRVWYPGMPVRFYGFPNEVIAYHQNADFVQTLNLEHEKLFHQISYLGPLRNKAERLYPWTGNEPDSVGYGGENAVAAILAARNRKINRSKNAHYKSFEEIIAEKLQIMGLIDEFKVDSISELRHEYEVKVRTKGSDDLVDLPDVGFGISQVLPVLVQCFYAPPGSIILMEQPEIHLHPNAQAALADIMIDAISARENGKARNIQLIIETHSEHFLRRIQRRIAENKVGQDKVTAYFANVSKRPAYLEPLQLDQFGNILNWPDNFFGNEMEDIIEQAKAAMKKHMGQTDSGMEVVE